MNRSCKYCRWRKEKEGLVGVVHICKVDEEPTTLDGYCDYFKEVKGRK